MDFSELIPKVSPPWLKSARSGAFISRTVINVMDGLRRAGIMALKISDVRVVLQPDDALNCVAIEHQMPRCAGETKADHQARLADPFSYHSASGTCPSIVEAALCAGFTVLVIEAENADARPARTPVWRFESPPDTDNWSRFNVVVTAPSPFPAATAVYGDPIVYGNGCGSDFAIYGLGGDPCEWGELKGAIDSRRPKHVIPACYTFVHSGDYYGDPALTYGGGTLYDAASDTTNICL